MDFVAQVTPTAGPNVGGLNLADTWSWTVAVVGVIGTIVASLVGITQVLEFVQKQREKDADDEAARKCSNCGAALNSDDTFCGNCGRPVAAAQTGGAAQSKGRRVSLARAIGAFVAAIVLFALGAFVGIPGIRREDSLPAVTQPSGGIYVEYILDSSRGMLDKIEGRTKLEIAQSVLNDRLGSIPSNVNVGLRAFGIDETKACFDTKLVVPIQDNGAELIIEALPKLEARGTTPLGESLRQAADDFTFDEGRKNSIILITDAVETCGVDPVAQIRKLKELGINFTAHVIGLGVDEASKQQLEQIAATAGGTYHGANNEKELTEALNEVNTVAFAPPPGAATQQPQPPSPTPASVPPTATSAPPPPDTPAPVPTDTPVPLPTDTPVPLPTDTPVPPPPTPVPVQVVDVTREGAMDASSVYSGQYPVSYAFDGDQTTSWFSAGPQTNVVDGETLPRTTVLTWVGTQDQLITEIALLNNSKNSDRTIRTGFGFGSARVQVLDSSGEVVFDQSQDLPGTPDPEVHMQPNVVGKTVRVIFSGHEDATCGGISELQVKVQR